MIFVSKIQMKEQRWGRDKVKVICAVHMVGPGVKTLIAISESALTACLRHGTIFYCVLKQFTPSSNRSTWLF